MTESDVSAAFEQSFREKDDAKEVRAGFDCGITLKDYQDVRERDVLEAYRERDGEAALRDRSPIAKTSTTSNVAVEIMETLSPVVYWKKEFRPEFHREQRLQSPFVLPRCLRTKVKLF